MSTMKKIWELAKSSKRSIVLPESTEERNLRAAEIITKKGLAHIFLAGDKEAIIAKANRLGVNLDGIEVVDINTSELYSKFVNDFYELRKAKGITEDDAKNIMRDSVYFGTMMVKNDIVNGMVSGAIHSTGDLLRPALQIIKNAPGISIVSSTFIMELPDAKYGENGVLLFADCAINPDPNPDELASIAIATAETAKSLCRIDPKIAMLSFSTKGSANHPFVEKVKEAVRIAKEKAPGLLIDGELQLDAAIVPKVGELKAPTSEVAGKANVLIFPDLQSGNIGYKLVQRLANAQAIGPISQGFAKPVNDLSRGCSVDDIVNVAAITAVQSVK